MRRQNVQCPVTAAAFCAAGAGRATSGPACARGSLHARIRGPGVHNPKRPAEVPHGAPDTEALENLHDVPQPRREDRMRCLVVGATLSADRADALSRQLGPGAIMLLGRLSIPCVFVLDQAIGDRDPALECIPPSRRWLSVWRALPAVPARPLRREKKP